MSDTRIKSLEQDKAELRSEISALKESKRAAAELIYSLEARIAKLTEALKDIAATPDAKMTVQPDSIFAFRERAREALKEDV